MFGSISYSENPLLAEFRRLEQEMDELLSGSTPRSSAWFMVILFSDSGW